MTRGKLLFEPANQLSMQLTGYYSHAPNDLTTFGNQPLDGDTFIRALLPDIQLATKPNTSSLNIVPVNRLTTWGFNFKVDRKSVVTGKSVSVSVDLGGRRTFKKKKKKTKN